MGAARVWDASTLQSFAHDMAPKRKSTSGARNPGKKAQIVEDTTASRRPKRSTVGKPRYIIKRSNKPHGAYAAKDGADDRGEAGGARRRGRPRKTAPVPIPGVVKKRGRPPKISATVRETNSSATETTVSAAPKKRGRPPLSQQNASVPSSAPTRNQEMRTNAHDDHAEEHQGDEQYWLMKAEPNDRFENGHNVRFSISDLEAKTEPEAWDGVRNYQARNNMRAMRKGDLAFFYHSNCAIPGIVGVMRVVQEHTPDESALDPRHPYHDPKVTKENNKWDVVHVAHVKTFDKQITLKMIQENAKTTGELAAMEVLKYSRLSVNKVRSKEWRFILALSGEPADLGQEA